MPDEPLKLFFDECVGKPAIDRIRAVFLPLSDRYQIGSIFDRGWAGAADSQWIPRLKNEGWVIITADKGRRKRGEKLPVLCESLGISHIRLTKLVHHMKMDEKPPFLISAIRLLTQNQIRPGGRSISLSIRTNGQPFFTDRTEASAKRHERRGT